MADQDAVQVMKGFSFTVSRDMIERLQNPRAAMDEIEMDLLIEYGLIPSHLNREERVIRRGMVMKFISRSKTYNPDLGLYVLSYKWVETEDQPYLEFTDHKDADG